MSDSVQPYLASGPPELLAELLESARLDEPTAGQLLSLQGKLGPLFVSPPSGGGGGGGSSGTGGPAAQAAGAAKGAGTATAGLGLAKTVLVAAVTGVLAGTGAFQAGRSYEADQRTADAVAPVVSAAPVLAPLSLPPIRVEAAAREAAAPPPVKVAAPKAVVAPPPAVLPAPTPPPPPPSTQPTNEEVALLQSAMGALRSGDASGALLTLEPYSERFPSGALQQEAEVLRIEALVTLGRRDAARTRAMDFKAKWPTSTHVMRVDALVR